MIRYERYALGDSAVTIRFAQAASNETNRTVQDLAKALEMDPFPGFIEHVLTYTTVTVYYDPREVFLYAGRRENLFEWVCAAIDGIIARMHPIMHREVRVVRIPVCYGGEFGPDLSFVADCVQLTEEEVVALHAKSEYVTQMIGFMPGFPYLGGLPERISVGRKSSPRMRVPAGSVGIAGGQTGIYPFSSPGGWQIIGRTPLTLFDPQFDPPSVLIPGDKVRFFPIGTERFHSWLKRGKAP